MGFNISMFIKVGCTNIIVISIKQRQKHIELIYKIRLGLLIGSGNVCGLKESTWTLIGLGEV